MVKGPGRAVLGLLLRKDTDPMHWAAIFTFREPPWPLHIDAGAQMQLRAPAGRQFWHAQFHMMLNSPGARRKAMATCESLSRAHAGKGADMICRLAVAIVWATSAASMLRSACTHACNRCQAHHMFTIQQC